jgi:hypothetical protein
VWVHYGDLPDATLGALRGPEPTFGRERLQCGGFRPSKRSGQNSRFVPKGDIEDVPDIRTFHGHLPGSLTEILIERSAFFDLHEI